MVDFSRSLEPSFFGLMSLTKALAPIQWFFLVRRRFLGHNQPSLPLQQVTGYPNMSWDSHHQPGTWATDSGFRMIAPFTITIITVFEALEAEYNLQLICTDPRWEK